MWEKCVISSTPVLVKYSHENNRYFCVNILLIESTKTIQLKIKDADFDLVETMKKYANEMNYVSSMVFDNDIIIPARKLRPMVYAHLRGDIGLKSQVIVTFQDKLLGLIKQ